MSQLHEVQVRPNYREPGWPDRLVLKVAKLEYEDHLKEEADFLRRFDHPNVVRIFPMPGRRKKVYLARHQFHDGWRCYYAMELVSGGSLQELLEERGRLSVRQAVGITRQLAAALDHIHRHGVINLDLKPKNVLLRRRPGLLSGNVPRVVLCDFGIARELDRQEVSVRGIGTPEYTSPEQVREMSHASLPVDQRADIFLLGITLYEMLTGQVPFENIALIVQTGVMAAPPSGFNEKVRPELDMLVMRLLSKNTDGRYNSAREVGLALNDVSVPADWGRAVAWVLLGCLILVCFGLMAFSAVVVGQHLLA